MSSKQLLPSIYITTICVISLWTNMSYLFILAFYLLVLLKREWLIPMLLTPSLVDGALSSPDLVVPLGIATVILLAPILFWDGFRSGKKVPGIYVLFFLLFIVLVVLGFVVYGFRFGFDQQIFIDSLINISKLSFFLILLKFLINKGEAYIYKSLQNTLFVTAPVILSVIGYSLIVGETYGYIEYLKFGGAKHGTFTATLTAFSIYILYWFYQNDDFLIKQISAGILILVFYTILQMGSKNGLLSFTIMIFWGLFFFSKTKSVTKKVLVVGLGIIVIGIGATFFSEIIINSPTIERVTKQIQKEGIEGAGSGRAEIWKAGLSAFPSAPLLGWGGSNQAVRSIIIEYGGRDNVMHNTFLDALMQYGLIGLTLYLAFIWILYKRGVIIYKACTEHSEYLPFVPVFFFFMVLFSGMFVSWLWETLVWYQAVLILAIATILQKEK